MEHQNNQPFHVEQSDSFADFLNSIPLRSPRAKSKPKPAPTRYDLRKLYYDARRVMFAKQYPSSVYFDNKMPDVTTTNGHQRYMQDVINNLGHHAERVNTAGTPSKFTKSGWRTAGSTKGSTDVHCEIKIPSQPLPVGWKIEVKNKDTMLKGQLKYEAKMKRVGVLHSVIHVGQLDLFWDEYYKIIKL